MVAAAESRTEGVRAGSVARCSLTSMPAPAACSWPPSQAAPPASACSSACTATGSSACSPRSTGAGRRGDLRRPDGQDPDRHLTQVTRPARSRIVPGSALARLRRRRRRLARAQRGRPGRLRGLRRHAGLPRRAGRRPAGRHHGRARSPTPPSATAWAGALRHERLRVLTYPYEWTFSMLRDAALLQLDLSRAALAEGVLTKDATSYNVQFDGARPVFIDLGSFERLVPGEPWAGLPPVLRAVPQPALPAGDRRHPVPALAPRVAATASPPPIAAARPRGPQAASGATCSPTCASTPAPRRATPTPTPSATCRASCSGPGFGPKIIDAQMANLRKAVERLEWKAAASTWSTYSDARPLHRRRPRGQGGVRRRRHRRARRSRWCSTSAPTTAASPAWPSTPARRSPSPSTATTSSSTTSTGSSAREGERRILPLVHGPRRPVARPRLAAPGAAVVRRAGAPRPRAVPGRDPPPRARPTRCRSPRSWPSSTTSARRSWSRCPTATTRWPPACSAASATGRVRPLRPAAVGGRARASGSTVVEQVTLPSGTRTLYLCRPR